jgi:hypothetical protein
MANSINIDIRESVTYRWENGDCEGERMSEMKAAAG